MLPRDPLAKLSKPSSDLRLDGLRRDRKSFRDLDDRMSMPPAKHTDLTTPVGHLGEHLVYGCSELHELGMRVGGRGVERRHSIGRMLAGFPPPP